MKRSFTFLIVILIFFGGACQKSKKKIQTLADDAAWCWFSDPRAIQLQHSSGSKIIAGGVSKNGSVVAFSYDMRKENIEKGIIHPYLEVDDHNNPAFLELPSGDILSFYTRHHNEDLFMSKTVFAGNITQWEEPRKIEIMNNDEEERYGSPRYTYANPFMLSAEKNRIFLFGRWMGFKPVMIWSDNQGENWSNSRVVICPQPFDSGNRPYVKYYSDGKTRIHMAFTDGHPRNEPLNSIYYAYYEKGRFYRVDGSLICTIDSLPFEPREATLVYKANSKDGRAWIYDIKADENGYPVIAYVRYPTEEDHIYHYTRYNGKNWDDDELCHAGKWFPQTPSGQREREPHYSGGLAISLSDVSTVFLSREMNGIFEIQKWYRTENKEWKHSSITENSDYDQVRPVVPWGMDHHDSAVLWMENEEYIHYTNYSSRIKILSPV
ncbi:BNR-4 repeat-containing protein [Anaerophaga thermohalophila]|uniref:BNR-4 repeat-containing protein n=1 Tax=Anaerophaga thermohalophila TaxID=177400 RepID=UPI000237BEF1|nr:BNR-4 repeat-containing protein [Anaerophaga thermohalophila]